MFNLLKETTFILLVVITVSVVAENDVVSQVLNSNNLFQLYGYKNPTMEQRRYVWGISDKLVDLLLEDPKNDRVWKALHKYRTFTDGGVTQMFNDACFRALTRNQFIFYDRYIEGDDEALDRAADAAWGFSEVNSQSSNPEDMTFLYKNLSQIAKKTGNEKRKTRFLQRVNEAISDRKNELSGL